MKYKIKLHTDREIDVIPQTRLYRVSDFMGMDMHGIAIWLHTDSLDDGEMQPFAVITKSFGEFIGLKNCAYIDLNNCPYAEQLLKEGIAKDTGFTKRSGYCTYPLWEFNEDFLREHGKENYELYSREYDEYMSSLSGDDESESNAENINTGEMKL